MSFSTPVDVSACTTATRRASGCSRCASSRRCGSSGAPHSSSTRTTSAPQRRATSHMRSPNTPLTPTIDGVARLEQVDEARLHARRAGAAHRAASARCSVRKTVRRRAIVSSMIARNSGSMCPSIGRRERGDRLGVRVRRAGPEQQTVGDRHAPEPTSAADLAGVRSRQLPVAVRRRDEDGEPVLQELAAPRPRRRRRRPGRARPRPRRARRA